jgi:hypothetical protein
MSVKFDARQELPQVKAGPDMINMKMGKDAMPDVLWVQSMGPDTFDHFQIHARVDQRPAFFAPGIEQVHGTSAVPDVIDVFNDFLQRKIPLDMHFDYFLWEHFFNGRN